jgi:hypothetical protein
MIKQYRRSKTRFFLTQKRGTYLLFVLAVALALLGSFKAVYPAKKEGKWEDVRDFSGTLTIKRNADFAGIPIADAFKIKVKDDSLAVIQVTGTEQYGPYTYAVGTKGGHIKTETTLLSASGGAGVKESFSGTIDITFNSRDCPLCGPKIEINKKLRRYKIDLGACAWARGEKVRTGSEGTSYSHMSRQEICPHQPAPYNSYEGVPYDPLSNMIRGSYTVTLYGKVEGDGSMAVFSSDDSSFDSIPQGIKCPIHYSVSWNFWIKKPDYKVKIIRPKPGTEFCLTEAGLDLQAEARAKPESYNDEIQPWRFVPIEGLEVFIVPSPPVGPSVSYIFTKMPYDNEQFGRKKIYADNAEPVEIKMFFMKQGKGNPGEYGNPNWFYYWKQDAVPNMEYFKYDPETIYAGYFDDETGNLFLGGAAAEKEEASFLYLRTPRGRVVYFLPETDGVDTCARTVAHELEHKRIHDQWAEKISEANNQTPPGLWADQDLDGIPNVIEQLMEPELGIKWYDSPDTYKLAKKYGEEDYADYGDQELLCRLAEQGVQGIHEKDWACPGKQSRMKRCPSDLLGDLMP